MSTNRLYLLFPAALAIIVPALFAGPGCGSDSCQGARGKICEKACACGGKCTVAGIDWKSETACTFSFGAQCDPTQHDTDWAACSKALDTAKCSDGNIPDGGMVEDGGMERTLVLPEECSSAVAPPVDGGTGGAGGGGSATSGSSSSGG